MTHAKMLKARRKNQKTKKLIVAAEKAAKRLAKGPVEVKEKVKKERVKKEKVPVEAGAKVKKPKVDKTELKIAESKKAKTAAPTTKKGA